MKKKTNEEVLRTTGEKRTFLDAIITRPWKMLGHGLRHQEELHYIILKGIIEGKITAERPRNTYIGQIKCDARVNTFKEFNDKPSNRSDYRIGVVNRLSG